VNHIINLEKQRFIRDCKQVLKGERITNSLRRTIIHSSPGHVEYLKRDLNVTELRLVDIVIAKVKEQSKKSLSASSQRINILAISVLENLATENSEFAIEEITKRYRESINPIKALYYDLQEIIFLYDGKPKNKHHQFLINKFKDIESFEKIIEAVDKDIKDLNECKQRINKLKTDHNYPNTTEHLKKIVDLHNEMNQWKTLFEAFPGWIEDNSLPIVPTHKGSKKLCRTIKNLFK
tara:strand:- start:194 stop:901 length:708 start_codon:yes stop_codon:yes gene_type:complete